MTPTEILQATIIIAGTLLFLYIVSWLDVLNYKRRK